MDMHRSGRVARGLFVPLFLVVALAGAACSGGDDPPETSPTPSVPSPSPSESPTPFPIGTAEISAWVAVWKDAFERFANDLGEIVRSAKNRNFDAMRDALGRIPGDARAAVQKIDDAGAAPPGWEDEVARLRSLIDQAARASGRISGDCLSNPGLPCAADVATLLSVAGQLLDALTPFGLGFDFQLEL
jgi:hypothetical protein